MEGAMGWLGTGLVSLLLSVVIIVVSSFYLMKDLTERLYPGGNKQQLITVCEVESRIKNLENKKDGFFYSNGEKIDATIIEKRENEIKVQYNLSSYCMGYEKYFSEKWIPLKDFYYYPTQEDLAKLIKKNKK
jgi:hypothetical protein